MENQLKHNWDFELECINFSPNSPKIMKFQESSFKETQLLSNHKKNVQNPTFKNNDLKLFSLTWLECQIAFLSVKWKQNETHLAIIYHRAPKNESKIPCNTWYIYLQSILYLEFLVVLFGYKFGKFLWMTSKYIYL